MKFKNELDNIEREVNNYKEEKIRLEEQQKQLGKEEKELVTQLKEEGVVETDLQDKINELEIDLQEGILECQKILKSDK